MTFKNFKRKGKKGQKIVFFNYYYSQIVFYYTFYGISHFITTGTQEIPLQKFNTQENDVTFFIF